MKALCAKRLDPRGSILLLAVLLLFLLSALFLFAANAMLLGTRARESLQGSLEMLYVAEAGLSHGRAFCAAHGESSPFLSIEAEESGAGEASGAQAPFGHWLPLGRGEYRLDAFRLPADAQPWIDRDSGVLLVASARLEGQGRKRVCLLLEEPPSCRPIAWWEPD